MIIRDIILIITVLGMMVIGLFVMKRLDKFLDENKKRIKQEQKERNQCCVILTANMTDEELVEEIRTYQKKHGNVHITLYQDKNELYDELFSDRW